MSSAEEEEIFCICRTSDVSRFMIACDKCMEWFHGDCVKVTEREAKYIESYYCKRCRKKNPKLEIVFKKKKERTREEKERDREREHRKEKEKLKEREKDRHKQREDHHKEKERHRDRSDSKDSSSHKKHHHDHHKDKHRDKEREKEKEKERERRKEKERKKEKREKERREEKEREHKEKKEEAKREEKRKEEAKKEEAKKEEARKEELKKEETEVKTEKAEVKVERSDSKSEKSDRPAVKPEASPPPSKKSFFREPSDDDDTWMPARVTERKTSKDKNAAKKRKKPLAPASLNTTAPPPHSKRRRGRRDSETSEEEPEVDLTPRQCFGPTCTQTARVGSKYCSEQCGINLATTRIYQTLPDRIREWNLTQCEAEKRNRNELLKIHKEQAAVESRLQALRKEAEDLEAVIVASKKLTVDERDEDEDESEAADTIFCVTCGSSVQTGTAIRHMERCYNKIESQTSFASRFKTQLESERLFCDFYNPKEESYCKRLAVLCPEHYSEPKISDDEVCGYPIQDTIFGKTKELCRAAKKKCQAHYCWEKLRRASIDTEKVKQWIKADELIERERSLRASMQSRAGVLGLMLHSTFNHELDGRWQAQRAAQAAKQQQEAKRKAQQQKQKAN